MTQDLNRDTNWYPDFGATNHITHDVAISISAMKSRVVSRFIQQMEQVCL